MPAQTQQTTAFVLARAAAGSDSFERLTLFSPEHGQLLALHRLPKPTAKPRAGAAPAAPLDLFDEAEVWLESSNQGRTWFLKEHRLIHRPAGIGRTYEALRRASAVAALIVHNPVPDESREPIAALLRQAFAAFAAHTRADIVWLKTLFCFLRDEGYPVKQDWWQRLPESDRAAATQLLIQPLATLPTGSAADPATVATLIRNLESWLAGETELKL